MDTDSLYLANAEKELQDCILPERKQSGSDCGQKTAMVVSLLMQPETSALESALTST